MNPSTNLVWWPYYSDFPNVSRLPHTDLQLLFGCRVCRRTWTIPMVVQMLSIDEATRRIRETFESHRHLPEEDMEPLDPSGIPRTTRDPSDRHG